MCKYTKFLHPHPKMCKFTLTLFTLHMVFYSFFMYPEVERRKWMVVIVCDERETFFFKKKLIF